MPARRRTSPTAHQTKTFALRQRIGQPARCLEVTTTFLLDSTAIDGVPPIIGLGIVALTPDWSCQPRQSFTTQERATITEFLNSRGLLWWPLSPERIERTIFETKV